MVQLKAIKETWAIVIQTFQFLYGTIKSTEDKGVITAITNFNSSMVQLKVQMSKKEP